jgi:hypothetical protein
MWDRLLGWAGGVATRAFLVFGFLLLAFAFAFAFFR